MPSAASRRVGPGSRREPSSRRSSSAFRKPPVKRGTSVRTGVQRGTIRAYPMPQPFLLRAPFEPRGAQPKAIEEIVDGVRSGLKEQVLMGVTGSGKTNVMAWAIEELKRPALILSPNKTLAAQLWAEFRRLFPENAVEYFVSYYDYYQPEAYIARSDTYIEKDSSRNGA